MPQSTRNWYFEPDLVPPGAGSADADDIAPGPACFPAKVRQRHGARLLSPDHAAVIPGSPPGSGARTPSSTVYRARTLLIPADLLRDDAVVQAIDAALRPVGMRIASPDLNSRQERSGGLVREALRRLPRVAGLVPAVPEPGRPARPVVIDAWTALQALRAAADVVPSAEDGRDPALTSEMVDRIGLEHLLAGSAFVPHASTEGNDIPGRPSAPDAGRAGPGPGRPGSSGDHRGDPRAPVTVCLDPPARGKPGELGGRRPVVAILDTGVRAHPWLDVQPDGAGGYAVDSEDGFVVDDPFIQAAVYEEAQYAAGQQGDDLRVVISSGWDGPVPAGPRPGAPDDATGHGTFIAGIVRQAAPAARVLSIRIMHSDGVVYEGDLLCALALLADRIAAAGPGRPHELVDVVSLSLGYFDESAAAAVAHRSGLWQVIQLLLELGVAVAAAAGSYSTSRRFYPAAFSRQPSPVPAVPVISVGALNPDGSRARFSDAGDWVGAWAAGAAVVSTFPDDVSGYEGGFAQWSGTSFAAPLIAAYIAARLTDQAAALDEPGEAAATGRILTALKTLGWVAGPGRP